VDFGSQAKYLAMKPGLLDGFPFRFIIQRLNFGFFIEE
jgi:hypothetical protein